MASSAPTPRSALGRCVVTLALFVAVGCRPDARPPKLEQPLLWHGEPGFEVLVESRVLAPPPALGGNRLLAGWRGWRTGPKRAAARTTAEDGDDTQPGEPPARGAIIYAPFRDRVRVEIVHLGEPTRRDLLLDLAGEPSLGGTVHAIAAGRDLGDVPLTDPLRVPLPDDLPLGRVAIDLALPEGIAVAQAGLSSALPAGDAHVEGDALLQSGDSLVELFTHVGPYGETGSAPGASTARLLGQFVPPDAPGPQARFELQVDDARGRTIARFTWTPPGRGACELALPLPNGALRIRLLARGAGSPGRWLRLRVENEAVQARRDAMPPPASPTTAASPGLLVPASPSLVVVFVFDALRADRVGHLGAGEGRTPTLDRLAAEGLTFAAHRSVAPNTLPSTKSLFTGRVWRAGGGTSLAHDIPTLAELVHAAGYRTACVSGNQNVSATFAMTRGFDFDAPDVKFPPPRAARAAFNDNAARARAAAAAWIRTLGPGERGFLYVHVIHPHNPYDPPQDLAQRFTAGVPSRIDGGTDTLRSIDVGERPTTEADRKRLRGLYAASLAYGDRELAGLVDAATAGRAPGDVLFAITADHGEELFDHGGLLHGYTLYEEMLRIPLVLWSPGRIASGRVTRPTDTIDLFATLLAATRASAPPDTSGRLLLPAPQPDDDAWSAPRFAAASAVRGGIYGVRWGRWKVVLAPRSGLQWGMGSGIGRVRDAELVFDLAADPGEATNLAGLADVEVGWLRAELLRWIAAGAPERNDDDAEPVLDAEERSRLKALGYVGH